MTKHLFFSISAKLFSFSTLSLSLETISSIPEAFNLVASASIYLTFTSSSMIATYS